MNESINYKIHQNDEMMSFIVNKGKSKEVYFKNGRVDAEFIVDAIKRNKPLLLKNKRILEFGCGHGRITRLIPILLNPSRLVVSDVWDSAVNFCANEFNAVPFLISDKNPISKLKMKFDVIFSYSVFSHLPPHSFEYNLNQLRMILDAGGLLLFSVKGERFAKEKRLSLQDGYWFSGKKNETNNRLPTEQYGLTSVSQSFVETILNKVGLRLVEFVEHNIRQDLYVVEPI